MEEREREGGALVVVPHACVAPLLYSAPGLRAEPVRDLALSGSSLSHPSLIPLSSLSLSVCLSLCDVRLDSSSFLAGRYAHNTGYVANGARLRRLMHLPP